MRFVLESGARTRPAKPRFPREPVLSALALAQKSALAVATPSGDDRPTSGNDRPTSGEDRPNHSLPSLKQRRNAERACCVA